MVICTPEKHPHHFISNQRMEELPLLGPWHVRYREMVDEKIERLEAALRESEAGAVEIERRLELLKAKHAKSVAKSGASYSDPPSLTMRKVCAGTLDAYKSRLLDSEEADAEMVMEEALKDKFATAARETGEKLRDIHRCLDVMAVQIHDLRKGPESPSPQEVTAGMTDNFEPHPLPLIKIDAILTKKGTMEVMATAEEHGELAPSLSPTAGEANASRLRVLVPEHIKEAKERVRELMITARFGKKAVFEKARRQEDGNWQEPEHVKEDLGLEGSFASPSKSATESIGQTSEMQNQKSETQGATPRSDLSANYRASEAMLQSAMILDVWAMMIGLLVYGYLGALMLGYDIPRAPGACCFSHIFAFLVACYASAGGLIVVNNLYNYLRRYDATWDQNRPHWTSEFLNRYKYKLLVKSFTRFWNIGKNSTPVYVHALRMHLVGFKCLAKAFVENGSDNGDYPLCYAANVGSGFRKYRRVFNAISRQTALYASEVTFWVRMTAAKIVGAMAVSAVAMIVPDCHVHGEECQMQSAEEATPGHKRLDKSLCSTKFVEQEHQQRFKKDAQVYNPQVIELHPNPSTRTENKATTSSDTEDSASAPKRSTASIQTPNLCGLPHSKVLSTFERMNLDIQRYNRIYGTRY